jgi:acetoin utilization deacetylase AcuC-like enzyme
MEERRTPTSRWAGVSCLEGGYNLEALGNSVEAHLEALSGSI